MDQTTLRIRLLGAFSVEVDGALVADRAWRLRKARTLVKIAALAPGRRVHRDVLLELLWPDRSATAAANNLHQALYAARRALGDPGALTLADDVLALSPDAWIDIDAFEARAPAGYDPDAALALYTGELLPEDRFEPWTEGRRTALQELQLDLCVRAAEAQAAAGQAAAGIAILARAPADAPRHEPIRRALMRAFAIAGRHQDALAQYEELRDALRAHNEAEPDPETRALYRALLGERDPGPARRRPALPVQLTSFVGRARELTEVHHLLARTRLLTLTGPGGAGKTRLALQAAATLAEPPPDGAWLVDLGGLRDPVLVPQAVATTLGLPIPANRPILDALTAHLTNTRGILVLLDTCEHVLDACAHLAEALLAAGPQVRLLATSREPLRCAAEVTWRVPSLAEAPALFHERADAVTDTCEWTAEQGALVQEICWRLDRMPLAVELAAARTGALTLEQIAARLGDSLDVLSAGSRTALTRQQTLRATIGWSHDLLTDDERVVFRRLAVFAGGCSLEAAEAVAAGNPIEPRQVADLVARLVDKSLLVAEDGRFRYVDTIRQFADERLTEAGERDAVAHRHIDWCLELACDHDPLDAAIDGRSLRTLEDDHDNLRVALSYALVHDPQTALALAAQLWRFWLDRSWFVEGTRWMDAVLDAAPERTPLRVEALLAAAGLALRRGDSQVYLRRLEESVAISDDLGDPVATAEAQLQHAMLEAYVIASDRPARLFAEALETAERLDQPGLAASAAHASALAPWQRADLAGAETWLRDAIGRLWGLAPGPNRFLEAVTFGVLPSPEGPGGATRLVWEATMFPFRRLVREQALGLAYNNLAWALRGQGRTTPAQEALDEALRQFRAVGDRSGEALTLAHLGHLARSTGRLDLALERLEAAVALRRELGEQRDARVGLLGLGLVRGAAGDLAGARAAFRTALEHFEATDDLPAMAGARTDWAVCEERHGDLERARELYAEGAALWGTQRLERIEAWGLLGLAAVQDALGDPDEAATTRARARGPLQAAGDERGLAEADAQEALSERKGAPT